MAEHAETVPLFEFIAAYMAPVFGFTRLRRQRHRLDTRGINAVVRCP